jgi:GTP-binding protein EngB required for normal cell division
VNETSPATAPERTVAPPNEDGGPSALAAALGRIEPALETALGVQSPLVARLRALHRRLAHERLQIAVIGQFKRGKSTFINALLGAAVLPTGVIPLTAVATFIAWRREPLIVVSFTDDRPSQEFHAQAAHDIRSILFRFVAEEANPKNRLGIARVDLFYPAAILSDGAVIIDTPGVGSTLRHNTEAALQALPESDAAFFVISADPPITEVELEYLRRLKSAPARVFFVVNKADYLQPGERRPVVDFLRKVLVEKSLIAVDEEIFCVSARDGLQAKRSGDARALEASGFAALEKHIVRALAGKKRRWLEDAIRGKAANVLSQVTAELDLRLRALQMPIEELAAKAEAFQDALRSIEEQRRVARDLLSGDHRRLRQALDSRIGRLRTETAARLTGVIDDSLAGLARAFGEEAARAALAAAMREEFEASRETLVSEFAADAGAVFLACQNRVDTLVERVRHTAAKLFDTPLGATSQHEHFELVEDPYWVTESTSATLIPDPGRLLDRLLPARIRRMRLRARMIRQADELIVRNAENLRWAILRGLDETFRKVTGQFEEQLDEAISVTRDVIGDALARRDDRSFAVRTEVDRLNAAAVSLAALGKDLHGESSDPAGVEG